jgi:hypothetical protein
MTDQQDMLAYVNSRLAGTEQPPPPPGPSPMAGYVLAQGARGLTVPPRTMMDQLPYLEGPDTGNEPVNPGAGPNATMTYPAHEAYVQQQNDLMRQMNSWGTALETMPQNHPDRPYYQTQFDQAQKQWDKLTNPGPSWLTQMPPNRFAGDPAAATIQGAAEARRAAPRQPLRPPAPGGVPSGVPADTQ